MRCNIRNFLIASLLVALIPSTYASKYNKGDELREFEKAKITLIEAINIAEKSSGGKACKAKFKGSKEGSIYKIDVVEKEKTTEIKVDAMSWEIVTTYSEQKERSNK